MVRRARRRGAREPMPARGSSDREVAEFWDTHSVADYWDELEPIELRRRSAPRRVVTLRLDPRAVEALRVIARRRGIEYSALARSWITDRLRDEIRKASARSR